ncbi:MAG: sensor histidine kinase [Terriglobia bacterium]
MRRCDPPILDENGLPEAVRWYVTGLAKQSGLKIDLSISEGFGRLPRDTELALFRIVQESLTNVHRHSESKSAGIRLTREAQSINVEIEDEGKGIPAEKLIGIRAKGSGVGIAAMRERVRHLGGVMNIHSSNKGTKISVTFPASTSSIPEPHHTARPSIVTV